VLYEQAFYIRAGYGDELCREKAEKVADEVLSLPVHPSLSKTDADKIIKVVKGL
jgi:dTDP-4-amino-4,6-dideoxygalactose transaminase